MAGAQFFMKLVAENAFLQIRVDEESFKLLTVNPPWGRFRFLWISWDSQCHWGVSSPHSRDHRTHRKMSECTGWHDHLGRYTWTAWKKNNWSSASCQTIKIKTELSQVSIQPASIDIPRTHDIEQGNSTRRQRNHISQIYLNQPTNQWPN